MKAANGFPEMEQCESIFIYFIIQIKCYKLSDVN